MGESRKDMTSSCFLIQKEAYFRLIKIGIYVKIIITVIQKM